MHVQTQADVRERCEREIVYLQRRTQSVGSWSRSSGVLGTWLRHLVASPRARAQQMAAALLAYSSRSSPNALA